MAMYDRQHSEDVAVFRDSDDVVSWMAHPDEEGARASHAIRTGDGVWVVDPVDGADVDDILDSFGDVVGVAVLSSFHGRHAGQVARRHDVAVHVPEWMDRIEDRVKAPVERYALSPDEDTQSEFDTIACRPFPGWQEVFLYHDPSGTLGTK